jgi:hypothetical protein
MRIKAAGNGRLRKPDHRYAHRYLNGASFAVASWTLVDALLSGMKLSVPLSLTISTFLANLFISFRGWGANAAPRCTPVGETGGSKSRGRRSGGDHPARTSGFRW